MSFNLQIKFILYAYHKYRFRLIEMKSTELSKHLRLLQICINNSSNRAHK